MMRILFVIALLVGMIGEGEAQVAVPIATCQSGHWQGALNVVNNCIYGGQQDYARYCGDPICNSANFRCQGKKKAYIVTGQYGYGPGDSNVVCETYDCLGMKFPGVSLSARFPSSCLNPMTPQRVSEDLKASSIQCGSIIQTTNQVLGERIPLQGSSFDLIYFSNRVVGRLADYALKWDTSDHPNATGYSVSITDKNLMPVASDNPTYQRHYWNGLENSVLLWGSVERNIVIEELNSILIPEANVKTATQIFIGNFKAKNLGLGGWVPTIWHFYDSNSKIIYSEDGSRREVTAVVDGAYYRVASSDGREVYYFDNIGRLVQTKTGFTGTVKYSFSYDSNGYLASITEPFNRVTTFSRYNSGVLKAIIAPKNIKTSITMNGDGYLATATNPNLETYSLTYKDAGGLLQTFTTPNGQVSTFAYNSDGNLISDINSSGKSGSIVKDENDKTLVKTKFITGMGRITENTKEVYFQREVVKRPSGLITAFSENPSQDVTQVFGVAITNNFTTDPRFGNQVKTLASISSNDFGSRNTTFTRALTLNNPSDIFSINTFTESAIVGAAKVTAVYTGANRTLITTSKLGKVSLVQLDEYERPVMEKIGDLVAKDYVYTENLLTKITHGTRKIVMSYYSNNLLKSIRNGLEQVTTFTYDSAHRVQTKTLPDSRVINYSYDSNGNLTSVTPPGKPMHELNYEIDGKLASYSPPILNNVSDVDTTYAYNNDRQMTKVTRPDGQLINYNYNATSGLLTSITGTGFSTISQTYSLGRLDGFSQGTRSVALGYNGSVPSYSFLADSGVQIVRFDRSPSSTFGGKIGQEKITTFAGGIKERAINYLYDNDEYLSKAGDLNLTYSIPNGQLEGTTIGRIQDYYYYNAFGEIRRYLVKVGSTVIYEYELSRDSIGRITRKIETLNGVTTPHDYVYDAAGRLVQVSTNGVVASTYEYDSNSNRTGGSIRGETTSATYDDQDRLTEYNGAELTYNANGELTSKGSAALVYDVFGNLKTHTKGTTVVSYDVDPLQRRLSRLVDGVRTTRYVYSPEGKIIGQLDANNKLIKAFVYATKSHVPDYYIDQNNNKFRIITDHLGSVRLVVSNTGRVLQMMEHDEFGRVLQDTRPGFLPFGFAGGLYEYRTGLVRFGARDYDPEVGRWLSKDPIRFNGNDTNLYGYVMQDPINFIDPSGLVSTEQIVGGGLVVVGGGLIHGGSGLISTAPIAAGITVAGGAGAIVAGALLIIPSSDAGDGSDVVPGLNNINNNKNKCNAR